MKTTTSQREATLGWAVDEVHALLSSPERLVELHPLVVSVTGIRRDHDQGETVIRFRVQERLVGPITFTYGGESRFRDLGAIEMVGHAPAGVTVRGRWELTPTGTGSTRARQTLEVTSPGWLHGLVAATARRAHDRQLTALRERCGDG